MKSHHWCHECLPNIGFQITDRNSISRKIVEFPISYREIPAAEFSERVENFWDLASAVGKTGREDVDEKLWLR